MLRVIATDSPTLFDGILKTFTPEKTQSNHMAEVFRRGNTFYLLLKKVPSAEIITWIASEFLPERLYFPYFGYSVDMIHEVGDIIVPNVFLGYSKALEKADVHKENRDSFIEEKSFIENFSEQKDYYVEDFGLSLGGILVSQAPENPPLELHEKMMLAYEADIYTESNVFPALEVLSSDEVPTMILAGITRGKTHAKYPSIDPIDFTIKNLMTTLELLEDSDESESQTE
ncbi:MAG: hypothetical protein HHAS10_05180 [Candidatus Altimarinota bacterium]